MTEPLPNDDGQLAMMMGFTIAQIEAKKRQLKNDHSPRANGSAGCSTCPQRGTIVCDLCNTAEPGIEQRLADSQRRIG